MRHRKTLSPSQLVALGALCVLSAAPGPRLAHAESLRCQGDIAAEGDSRLSLLYQCGQPLVADSYCAPVYLAPSPYPLQEPFASAFAPCVQTEELLYDRGPGNLLATVRIRSGVVQTIFYGRMPQ